MQNISEIRHHINAVAETKKDHRCDADGRFLAHEKSHATLNTIKNIPVRLQSTEGNFAIFTGNFASIFANRSGGRRTYVVVAGDKGMAGAYNTNLLQRLHTLRSLPIPTLI